MSDRLDALVDLSALLTGFHRVQLFGTGMADQYLKTLEDVLPAAVLDGLLNAYEKLPEGDEREAALEAQIFGHPDLGAVARNLILLWYTGTWRALPDEWRGRNGRSPLDLDRVVSPEAYVAGLQWVAAGAHPMGGRQQGFGSWALAPEGVDA